MPFFLHCDLLNHQIVCMKVCWNLRNVYGIKRFMELVEVFIWLLLYRDLNCQLVGYN